MPSMRKRISPRLKPWLTVLAMRASARTMRGGLGLPPPAVPENPAAAAALATMRAIEISLKRQRTEDPGPAPPPRVDPVGLRAWIESNGVDEEAAQLLCQASSDVQAATMDEGAIFGKNKSACLVARVLRLKKLASAGALPRRR